ncbi:MAG: tRNA (adenosine(37)-N6)-threonylcarbamoyltransferase complex transferase subunit TsaD, partial [Flavobacteriaceae bacterium]
FDFPKPKVEGLNFSFSGLKTSILYFLQRETKKDDRFIAENINDICAAVQYTILEILMDKLKLAVKQTGINQVAIGGGVAANSGIRKRLTQAEEIFGWTTYVPKFQYCTDNAGMIGIVGYLKFLQGQFTDQSVAAKARYTIGS